jgi:hypothetical protein
MGDSYHSFNNWLDQKQKMTNNLFFSGGDPSNSAYKLGNFVGNFAGDMAMFGGACRVLKATGYVGKSFLNMTEKLASSKGGVPINKGVIGTKGIPFPECKAINPLIKDTKVFRCWGDGAKAWGRSWTTTDPRTILNYRNAAGLPEQNTGRFLSEGILKDTQGVTERSALPLHGNFGGLPEVVVPNPESQISLQRVLGINPEF